MQFAVLGPVEVRAGPRMLNLRGDRQRRVLSGLLLRTGAVVGIDDLIGVVWSGRPPRTAQAQVRTAVHQLRQVFTRHHSPGLIRSEAAGYRLCVDADQVDLLEFESGVRDGRRLAAGREHAAAARRFRAALSLWRGPAFGGVAEGVLHAEATRLEEMRVSALELCIESELAQGEGDGLIEELTELIGYYPLRERFADALMLALYRNGRQAEAFDVYRRVSAALAQQLGVDPSTELRQRYEQMLRQDPRLGYGQTRAASALVTPPRSSTPTPAQLPALGAPFVGRAHYVRILEELAAPTAPSFWESGPCIIVISGTAGVGKTSLALHWAGRQASRFPDGQLFLNLKGFDQHGTAVGPAEALHAVLGSLGVAPDAIPIEIEERAALYRSVVAGRRLLIVLDNAREAEQVRPLLPSTVGTVVVVTSRNDLAGLVAADGAHPVVLDLMPVAEARQLIVRRLGETRVRGQEDLVDGLIQLCSRLPLALAVASAFVAVRPSVPLAGLIADLKGNHPLDALGGEDRATDVRSVLSWSYRELNPSAARAFRLLGLLAGDCTVAAVASLAAVPVPEARRLLDELSHAHLVVQAASGRLTMHDLLREYAGELARSGFDDDERSSAHLRWLDYYLISAKAAVRLLDPHRDQPDPMPASVGVTCEPIDGKAEALSWLAAEHYGLQAAVELAAALGFDAHAWQLGWTLETYFERHGHWPEWIAVQQVAVAAARQLGNQRWEAHSHRYLSRAYVRLGRYDEATEHLRQALLLLEEIGDVVGQAHALMNMVSLHGMQDQFPAAADQAKRALKLYRAVNHRGGQARALNSLGFCLARLGHHRRALDSCWEALRIHEEIDDRIGIAHTYDSLGYVQQQLGEHREAVRFFERAIRTFQESGDEANYGLSLANLGDAYHESGETESAKRSWQAALDVLDRLGDPAVERLRGKLRAA